MSSSSSNRFGSRTANSAENDEIFESIFAISRKFIKKLKELSTPLENNDSSSLRLPRYFYKKSLSAIRTFVDSLTGSNSDDDVKWEKISSIKRVGWEQVWDISVKNTHNFVAGHYINQKTGKALTPEQEKIVALRRSLELETWSLRDSEKLTLLAAENGIDQKAALKTKNTALVSDVLADFSVVREPRVGIGSSIANQLALSSVVVDNPTEEPAEGFAPSKSRIPTLDSYYTTGSKLLYQTLREAAKILRILSSKFQIPEGEDIIFGGIFAHNTYLTGGLGGGRATTTTGVIETAGIINVQGAGTSSFTNGINLADGCFSTRGTCAALGGTTINSGTANRLAYYSGASTLDSANFLTVDATNLRLGLATVTPATTFSVAGNTYLDSNVITFASSSAASLTLAFQKSATTTIPSDIFNAFSFATSTNVSPILSIGSSASGIPRVGIGTGTPAALFSIRNIWADNTLYIEDEANDTTPFVIDASGNVGIGSSTPSDKLTIYRGGFTQTLSTWPQPVVSQPLPVKGFLLDTTNIGNGEDIYVSGKYAYVTSTNNDRLTVIDVSDPVYPRVTGSVQDTTNLNGASEVFVQGKYAYVTANVLGGLAVVDISNPSSPRLVSSIADSALASAFGLYVSGKYAYVTATNRVTIVDISNPSSPVIVGSIVDSTRLALSRSIFVSGKYAYVTGFTNDYLSVIDISNPASPVIIGSVTAASMDGAQSVYVSGRYAYVVAYMVEGMAVVDISSPSNPQVVGSVSSITYFDDPWEIYVSGKYAYVGGYFDTTIVDISSSTAPYVVADSNPSSPDLDAARGIFVSGRYVYVVTTNGYLGIYDSLGID